MPATNLSDRPSRMVRKFLAAAEEDDQDWEEVGRRNEMALEEAIAREREGKELYFFYGSLMDPSVLQLVLGLPESPTLTPAALYGWHMKMWGPYPALNDDGPMEWVEGMVYEVEGRQLKDRLAAYETEQYAEHMCEISFEGREETVTGKTFVWAGDPSELREGKFNLKDWQMERVLDD